MNCTSQTSGSSEEEEFHTRFVSAMERHASGTSSSSGTSASQWDLIAMEVGRPVDKVKAHAYLYLVFLDSINNKNDVSRRLEASSLLVQCREGDNWRNDEIILFQTLLSRYGPKDKHRWQKISELMPMKTQVECKSFFEKNYSSLSSRSALN
jgi:hypothetical protein